MKLSFLFTKTFGLLILSMIVLTYPMKSLGQQLYQEKHRPQIHFSPKAKWMNDPNGLVYLNGTYHMFFQYYPDSTVWGPSHWGRATSKDLLYWEEHPIALYPDSLGIMASGSCVVDYKNTSGFGKNGKVPLIAIFTHIGMSSKKDWIDKSQAQSLAFSLNEGKTWTKYKNNPVIENPNLTDFRDPKVRWFEPTKRWIMTVASYDHVVYYSSPNLKDWKKESEFGKGVGGHDGVWECPDLISFDVAGKKIWVQITSINPGGINGGSATQYFVGDFDGNTFKPYNTATKWLDYGTDNYAGVTWSNTGNRNLFLGWMSNWQYANVVPTEVWRTSMTVPRELKLKKIGTDYLLSSEPVKELNGLKKPPISLKNISIKNRYSLSKHINKIGTQYELNLTTKQVKDFSVTLSNNLGEQVIVGYDKAENSYYIDRRKSGNVAFEKGFAKKFFGPRLSKSADLKFKIIVDVASVELFADDGLTVMTGIFFPNEPFISLNIKSPGSFLIDELRYAEMKSIWRQ